jgi:hypothetical protein
VSALTLLARFSKETFGIWEACRHENLEDPMAIVIEDMIYVAVEKEVKEFKSILLWALQNSGGKRICILHVHQPAQLIPFSRSQIHANPCIIFGWGSISDENALFFPLKNLAFLA